MTVQPQQSSFRPRPRRFRWWNMKPNPSAPRPERRDCQGRLVTQLLTALGDGWTLADAGFRPWCSATFIGAQHRIILRHVGDDAIDRALEQSKKLPELEFRITGHVVADLEIDAVRPIAPGIAQVELAVLTVEDW